MKNTTPTASPITLHLLPDLEPYEEHPAVGIVARASVTVPGSAARVELESPGVWGIECPHLAPGDAPDDSWVVGDYGDDQIAEVRAALAALGLEPGTPTPG